MHRTFIIVETFPFEVWLFIDDPSAVEDTEAAGFLLDVEALEVGELVHHGDGVARKDLVLVGLLLATHHIGPVDAPEGSLVHDGLLPRFSIGSRLHLEPVAAHRVVLADASAEPEVSVAAHSPDDSLAAGDPDHHPVHLGKDKIKEIIITSTLVKTR